MIQVYLENTMVPRHVAMFQKSYQTFAQQGDKRKGIVNGLVKSKAPTMLV